MNNLRPKVQIFHCINSFEPADILNSACKDKAELKLISMPCSGKLDILYITKAFEGGADGVAVMMCKQGECKYIEGNKRAKKRIEVVEELLVEAGLGKGRTSIIQISDTGMSGAIKELEEFCQKLSVSVEVLIIKY